YSPRSGTRSPKHSMPLIKGHVTYENLTFPLQSPRRLQLYNVNLEFPCRHFCRFGGRKWPGKSTITKLLARLYEPESGRIPHRWLRYQQVELYPPRR
ncbi:MAG UNVERIFIED_CONTAM: hypothetical protein LVR29_06955, partial [Microcystis novacekii LVE1205-3]